MFFKLPIDKLKSKISLIKTELYKLTLSVYEYLSYSVKFYKIQIYIIKQFLLTFLSISILLTILAVILNLVMDLNWFLHHPEILKEKFNKILVVYLLRGPYLFSYIAPLCVLISISYVISRMSRNFELVAIVNAGISLKKLFAPLMLTLFIMSILFFFFQDQIVTISGKQSRTIERIEIWNDTSFLETTTLENIKDPIKSQNKSITYTEIGFISKDGEIKNVKINKFFENTGKIDFKEKKFEGGLIQYTIYAKYGKWDDKIKNWKLKDVEIFEFNEKTELVSRKFQKEYIPEFKLDPPSFFFPKKYDFSFLTLAEMNEELNKSLSSRMSFEAGNYYQKLMQMLARPSISFSLLISGLIALGFVTVISRNLTFINMVFQSVIRYVIYFIIFLMGMWIGENRILPPLVAIWLPNIIFLSYGIYLNVKVKT